MSTASTATANHFVAPIRFMIGFADMLVSDIDENRFSDRCGTTINHPAFVLGHCAYYAGIGMQMLGGDIDLPDSEKDLYEHGKECLDDASLYPTKDEAIKSFNERIQTVADFIEQCEDDVFEASAAGTFFEDKFPTLGAVAGFMMVSHIMFHLGQVSAWRRVAGMGSAS